MKKMPFLLVLLLSLPSFGQEEQKTPTCQLMGGITFHWNHFNEISYLDRKSPGSLDNNRLMTGFELRFTFPTKIKNIDLAVGTIFESEWGSYSGFTDYKLDGGGIYFGINPKLGNKNFGVTTLIAVGVLSYKEYYSYYNEATNPVTDIYEKKASFGLGAMSSVGVYAKIGPVGIHPQVQAIFSGGGDTSFLFYGFVLPLTIQF